jgi:hypothetical protein
MIFSGTIVTSTGFGEGVVVGGGGFGMVYGEGRIQENLYVPLLIIH